ncbi:MAG: nitrous oxide-stimulated promoter family protein [Gudongella sp.]|nr:nitrous oxide-stimulated promoter family protein [Gudongella sp.]
MNEDSKQIKIKKEISILTTMIDIFYKNKNHREQYTTTEIEELKNYCKSRILNCPVILEKTFCSSCKIHCYDEKHRAFIKKVMKYSGPKMIFFHPILLIKHLLLG